MPTIKGFPCLLSRVLLAVFGLVLALVLIGYAVNFRLGSEQNILYGVCKP